ncbi:YdcF family protein [Streptomyces cyaneofuscatus]
MPEINDDVRAHAKLLWSYHDLPQKFPESVDLILVAGSHDGRVAERGAEIARSLPARFVVTSGGYGKITGSMGGEPEAQRFRRIMEEHGISPGIILCEDQSSNMGQNIQFTRRLIEGRQDGTRIASAIVVTKPYMKRRALATALKQWPGVEWFAAAPELSFGDYASDEVPERRMIELMVGDTQRIETYAEKGFQVPQEVPPEVSAAFRQLVKLGFTQHVDLTV